MPSTVAQKPRYVRPRPGGMPSVARPQRPVRIVRVERPDWKNVGYFAYADRRRYFSDTKYGGPAGAKAAAEAWLKQRS